VNVHGGGGGGAACDTVKDCPAIVSVPVRAGRARRGDERDGAIAMPEAALVTVNQAHWHSRSSRRVAEAVTATEPEPPRPRRPRDAGAIVKVQGGAGAWPGLRHREGLPANRERSSGRSGARCDAECDGAITGARRPLSPSTMAYARAATRTFAEAVTATEPAPAVSATSGLRRS
jgi:hypothetical protein